MNDMAKSLGDYVKLPYTIVLRKDDEGDWIARIEELSGCVAHGATPTDALENIEEVKQAWLEDAIAAGGTIPEPRDQAELPSGKWLQRVPRSLHKKLAELAEREGVSLNQFVTSVLAEAVGGRATTVVSPFENAGMWIDLRNEEQHGHWYESWPLESWPLGSFKQPRIATWKVQQPKPTSLIDLNDALKAISGQIVALPDRLEESDFKVNDRATKKELT